MGNLQTASRNRYARSIDISIDSEVRALLDYAMLLLRSGSPIGGLYLDCIARYYLAQPPAAVTIQHSQR